MRMREHAKFLSVQLESRRANLQTEKRLRKGMWQKLFLPTRSNWLGMHLQLRLLSATRSLHSNHAKTGLQIC